MARNGRTRWFVGAACVVFTVLQAGCSLLFPFKVAPKDAEFDECRTVPPVEAPVFAGDPRHLAPLEDDQGFGAALAAGHFTRPIAQREDLELAVGAPGAGRGSGLVVRYRKDDPGGERIEYLLPGDYALLEDGAGFGAALAAGDFDADGSDDLAIGVPGVSDESGAVVVEYGGAGRWTRILAPPGAGGRRHFGAALAVGDFDDDGADDLIVGEPGEEKADRGDAARVWVIWGRPGGEVLSFAESTRIAVPAGEEQGNATRFGASLAVGHFVARADPSMPPRLDLAVGAPRFDRPALDRSDVGRVYVFRPPAADPRSGAFELAVTLDPRDGWERYAKAFGQVLAAGNFNADRNGTEARVDLAIGAPESSIPEDQDLDSTFSHPSGKPRTPKAGLVFIAPHDGTAVATTLRVLSQDLMGFSQKNDGFGTALAVADFNGDGRDDLAIGCPSEKLKGASLSRVAGAGAIYVRFGNLGEWNVGGGIPQLPQVCLDYIDAVRGSAFSRRNDGFGAVLLAAPIDEDGEADLVVGVPEADLESADGIERNAGAVWVGLNQATELGSFDGRFTGEFRDDACGGADPADFAVELQNREQTACGTVTTSRDLCFVADDENVPIDQLQVHVLVCDASSDTLSVPYNVRDAEGHRVGTLTLDLSAPVPGGDLLLDLEFRGRGVKRRVEGIELRRQ